MNAYERVTAARATGRPTATQYIDAIFTDFTELHGDRRYADDAAIVGGLAFLDGRPVTVIGIEKGRDTAERVRRNFGSAHPEGYRKALRLMKQAEKFHRPVICLVDTSGAYCGIGAEERGQGLAIAENLVEMSALKTPILSVVIGEGGSGGALALAVADEVWMLENAIYSVISPEGAASIIWKDAKRTREASESLRLTAEDLLSFGVIEQIFSEKQGFDALYVELKKAMCDALQTYAALPVEQLLAHRYEKYRKIGRMGGE